MLTRLWGQSLDVVMLEQQVVGMTDLVEGWERCNVGATVCRCNRLGAGRQGRGQLQPQGVLGGVGQGNLWWIGAVPRRAWADFWIDGVGSAEGDSAPVIVVSAGCVPEWR